MFVNKFYLFEVALESDIIVYSEFSFIWTMWLEIYEISLTRMANLAKLLAGFMSAFFQ